MTFESLIISYGYLAVFLGVALEGEAIVMTGGFLAYRGLLDIKWVVVSALAGSICTYQGLFWLGKKRGSVFLERHPAWQSRVAGVQQRLMKYHLWVIAGYRLFFGLRSITPFALGMGELTQRRFFLLDLVPALVWAVAFSFLGFALGHAFEKLIQDIERYQGWIVLTLVTGGLLAWVFYRLLAKSPAE